MSQLIMILLSTRKYASGIFLYPDSTENLPFSGEE